MEEKKSNPHFFFTAQEWLSLAFFTVMCGLLVLQLASRYLFSRPLLFTEEFSRFCYVWIAFLGLAVAHRRKDHIRIDMFVNMLPAGLRRVVERAVDVVCIGLLGYLGYWGVEYMIFNEYSVAASVDLPLYYIYAALPIGCLLGIINIVCGFFRTS